MYLDRLKIILDKEIEIRNSACELCEDKPDPLMVASRYQDESIALICALFAYGNAKLIVKFLNSLDFSILECSEKEISLNLQNHYYRFQKSEDVIALFIALKRLKQIDSIENIVYNGYKREDNIIDGLVSLVETIRSVYPMYDTQGYDFLVGQIPTSKMSSPYKRYMMYFRWMVRKDNLDMGLWSKIDKAHLLMPLDTHTFHLSQKLGLLNRRTYDMKAVIELTEQLKKFDASDPIKYDFAIYRLGQEGQISQILEKITTN
ncbi:MAG: TIGR02757 family protein [Campylobacterales bacterium]|nr:TIGR02757 family protein [Campylobacterales bacterium]